MSAPIPTAYNTPMWISTATRLPNPGQKVFFTTGHMIYRARFEVPFVRPSEDGVFWVSFSGFPVTHWMPEQECREGVPAPPEC